MYVKWSVLTNGRWTFRFYHEHHPGCSCMYTHSHTLAYSEKRITVCIGAVCHLFSSIQRIASGAVVVTGRNKSGSGWRLLGNGGQCVLSLYY